jgi:hypothetical protein
LETPYEGPRDDVEGAIAGIWAEELKLKVVGVHDNYLELGGDSLFSEIAASRMSEHFGIDISVSDVLDRPTVAEFAAYIRSIFGGRV